MATMSATRYDYGHSPTWARDPPPPREPSPSSASSSRNPSSSRTRPGHALFPAEGSAVRDNRAYARSPSQEAHYRPAHESVEYDGSSSFLPDVRVIAPSRLGESHSGYPESFGTIGTIPDEDASVYSQRMSTATAQQYHSSVFQQQQGGRDSMDSVQSPNGSTHFNQLFPGDMSSSSIHHLSSMSMNSALSRESWQTGTGPEKEPVRPDSNVDPFSFMQYESSRGYVPKVVVSSPSDQSFRSSNQPSPAQSSPRASVNSVNGGQPATLSRLNGQSRLAEVLDEDEDVVIAAPITPPPFQPPQGRVPSATPPAPRNFSRPNRVLPTPPSPPDHSNRPLPTPNSSSSTLNKPGRPPITGSQDAKLEVLERNQQRRMQHGTSPMPSPTPSAASSSYFATPSSSRPVTPQDGARLGATSPSRYPPASPTPSSSQLHNQGALSPKMPSRPPRSPNPAQGLVALPAHFPNIRDRHASSESLYSDYSYYNLDGSKPPSPSSPGMKTGLSPVFPAPSSQLSPSPTSTLAASSNSPSSPPSKRSKSPHGAGAANQLPSNPQTADDFLALGIAHHEANRLEESAACFEKAAKLESGGGLDSNDLPFGNMGKAGEVGSAVGMLMWGLSLRHGWGVPKDEAQALKWLKAAAEHAVVDLQKGAAKSGKEVIRKELVLAVYEVGQSFFHGWGVKKDKVMAVSYFQTAAKLGDPDAQQDLAFCLANGKGCKKDRKAAAKWYRAAADQGASTVGLAWIYKSKYMD